MGESLWWKLCRTNVNFYLFVVACTVGLFIDFVNFYDPCVTFIALNIIMIFCYRFATDFTGKINNHSFKGKGMEDILVDRLII